MTSSVRPKACRCQCAPGNETKVLGGVGGVGWTVRSCRHLDGMDSLCAGEREPEKGDPAAPKWVAGSRFRVAPPHSILTYIYARSLISSFYLYEYISTRARALYACVVIAKSLCERKKLARGFVFTFIFVFIFVFVFIFCCLWIRSCMSYYYAS